MEHIPSYSYIKDNGKNEKTCKGVKKDVIKKNITHENYRDTLMNGKQMMHKINTIRSDHHQLGSYQLNKMSLSCFDDKGYILEDGLVGGFPLDFLAESGFP